MEEHNIIKDISARIRKRYEQILDMIDKGKYPCMHLFCKDLARFVPANRVLVFLKTGSEWDKVCDYEDVKNNANFQLKTVPSDVIEILVKKVSEEIIWLPGKIPVHKQYAANVLVYIIPIWQDSGYQLNRGLIVFINPYFIDRQEADQQKMVENIKLLIPSMVYRACYFWLTKTFYEHRLQNHLAEEIIGGQIEESKINETYNSLLKNGFGWPIDFKTIYNLFRAGWVVFLKIINGRKKGEQWANEKGFWENETRSDKESDFWNYMEEETENLLCQKPLCKLDKTLCNEDIKAKKKLFSAICKFIKWPLLYKEGRYNYIRIKERTPEGKGIFENEYEKIKLYKDTFLKDYEKEETTTNGIQRSSLRFC